MQPVTLFELATQQARWLSVRQSAVASNIANANTHGYRAVDAEPFEKVLDRAVVSVRSTQPGHLGAAGGAGETFAVREQEYNGPPLPSGNTVQLESELMKAGEVRRSFELNTAIVKAFHRMMLMSTKA